METEKVRTKPQKVRKIRIMLNKCVSMYQRIDFLILELLNDTFPTA
jgi:hypothetical protein